MSLSALAQKFGSQDDCISYLERVKWHGQARCGHCGSRRTHRKKLERRHQCLDCLRSFSVLQGTIFQGTKLPLIKWFQAMTLILNARKGISSRQLGRDLGVNKDTAWYLQMRIRMAMDESDVILKGIVETDETFIGGKRRNLHRSQRLRITEQYGTGYETMKPLLGMLQREGKVITKVLEKAYGAAIKPVVKKYIDRNATLVSDGFGGFSKMGEYFTDHQILNHEADQWVRGTFHTNTLEGFWSILKRSIIGQYHHVSRRYLQLYANEFSFKYNHRHHSSMFALLLSRVLHTSRSSLLIAA